MIYWLRLSAFTICFISRPALPLSRLRFSWEPRWACPLPDNPSAIQPVAAPSHRRLSYTCAQEPRHGSLIPLIKKGPHSSLLLYIHSHMTYTTLLQAFIFGSTCMFHEFAMCIRVCVSCIWCLCQHRIARGKAASSWWWRVYFMQLHLLWTCILHGSLILLLCLQAGLPKYLSFHTSVPTHGHKLPHDWLAVANNHVQLVY